MPKSETVRKNEGVHHKSVTPLSNMKARVRQESLSEGFFAKRGPLVTSSAWHAPRFGTRIQLLSERGFGSFWNAVPGWFLASGFWEVVSGEWFLGSGFWQAVSGKWFLGSGFWRVVSGEWFLGSGFWEVVSGEFLANGFWGGKAKTGPKDVKP